MGARLVQTLVCWLGVALLGEPTVRSPLGALLPWLEIHKESACTSFLRRVHGRCSELESLFPAVLSWKTGSTSLILSPGTSLTSQRFLLAGLQTPQMSVI